MKNKGVLIATVLSGGATPWYRAGGAPAPLAVWQAKGAASLAVSLVNLVNPGTYDLTAAGTSSLDADGWAANASMRLLTGIVPALTYSIVSRVSGQNDAIRSIMGCYSSASQLYYLRNSGSGNVNFNNGNQTLYEAIFAADAVVGMAGKNTFYNGVQQDTMAAGGTDPTHEIYLMAVNNGGSVAQVLSQGHMQAAAVWNSTLTPAQMIAVQTAMAAL